MKQLLLVLGILISLLPAKAQTGADQLLFMENKGQVAYSKDRPANEVLFAARKGGANVYITPNVLYYQFTRINYPQSYTMQQLGSVKDVKLRKQLEKQITRSTHRFSVELIGANPTPTITKLGESAYTENYFLGHCPQGIEGVHGYEKIIFNNVYKGIDWVIYSRDGVMEYDFIIHEGADPASIKLKVKDADAYRLTAKGELTIQSKLGEVTEKAPVSYNEEGQRVDTKFIKTSDGNIGFAVKARPGQPLRIDPAIAWATYYGGSGDDYGNATVADRNGNVYLAGTTSSTSAIALGGFKNALAGSFDAFLVKLSPAGTRLWATYYGGTSDDYGTGCAADTAGNVFLAGYTYSNAGIASGGAQTGFGGIQDAFLVKFSPAGARTWATYLGGVNEDQATGCAADVAGNVYLAGYTGSTAGLASGGFQTSFGGAYYDAFLVKYNPAGSRLWSTYYGGAGDDFGGACAVDAASGAVFVTGYTSSTAGIASGGFNNAFTPGGYYDGFLVKFNPSGSRAWATYYGGEGNDFVTGCAVDGTGKIFLSGYTNSTTGIAAGGYQNTIGTAGNFDAFLVKLNASGSRAWSTYYGNAGIEYGNACALDAAGNIYLAGSTTSSTGIAYAGFKNSYSGGTDAFLAKFTTNGGRTWATYFGGTSAENAAACAVAGIDSVFIAGYTASKNGIASGGYKNSFGGGSYDGFLAKTSNVCTPSVTATISPTGSICQGTKAVFTAAPVNGGSAPAFQWKKNNTNVGTNHNTYSDSLLKTGDSVWVILTTNAACAMSQLTATSTKIKITVNAKAVPKVTIAANPFTAICPGTKVSFTATPVNGGTAPAYQWKKNNTNVGTSQGIYADSLLKAGDSVWVILTSSATCLTAKTVTSNKLKPAVNPLPAKPGITLSRSAKLCLFDSVTLSTTATGSWQWQRNNKDITGAAGSKYTAYIAGSYRLRVTSAAGCSNLSDTVAVTVTNMAKPSITLSNDTLVSSAASGNQWFYNLNPLNGATAVKYKPVNMGYYSVQVTAGGCKSPMSDLYVYTANTLMGKAGTLAASLQPNPASSFTTLSVRNGDGPVQVTVMDVTGRKLWVSGKINSSQVRIPVTNLAGGTYLVLVENNTHGYVIKMLVHR